MALVENFGPMRQALYALPFNELGSTRLFDTCHLRGVDEMSSSDVRWYFARHRGVPTPRRVDWLNPSSCNARFRSRTECRKAIIALSRPIRTKDVGAGVCADASKVVEDADIIAWRRGLPNESGQELLLRLACARDCTGPAGTGTPTTRRGDTWCRGNDAEVRKKKSGASGRSTNGDDQKRAHDHRSHVGSGGRSGARSTRVRNCSRSRAQERDSQRAASTRTRTRRETRRRRREARSPPLPSSSQSQSPSPPSSPSLTRPKTFRSRRRRRRLTSPPPPPPPPPPRGQDRLSKPLPSVSSGRGALNNGVRAEDVSNALRAQDVSDIEEGEIVETEEVNPLQGTLEASAEPQSASPTGRQNSRRPSGSCAKAQQPTSNLPRATCGGSAISGRISSISSDVNVVAGERKESSKSSPRHGLRADPRRLCKPSDGACSLEKGLKGDADCENRCSSLEETQGSRGVSAAKTITDQAWRWVSRKVLDERSPMERRGKMLRIIAEDVCETWQEAKCHLVGSQAFGLAVPRSDVDVEVSFGLSIEGKAESRGKLARILSTLRKKKRNKLFRIKPILKSKVPLVRLVDRASGIVFDVTCASTRSGVWTPLRFGDTRIAAWMIRNCLSKTCRCVVTTLRVLKQWAFREFLLAADSIGAYPFTLLTLSYFQRQVPPLAPPLLCPELERFWNSDAFSGDTPDKKGLMWTWGVGEKGIQARESSAPTTSRPMFAGPSGQASSLGCGFDENADTISEEQACSFWTIQQGSLEQNQHHRCQRCPRESLGLMLLGFFKEHAPGEGLDLSRFALHPATGKSLQRNLSRGGVGRKSETIVIEDPVRRGVNTARKITKETYRRFQVKCDSALRILQSQGLHGLIGHEAE